MGCPESLPTSWPGAWRADLGAGGRLLGIGSGSSRGRTPAVRDAP